MFSSRSLAFVGLPMAIAITMEMEMAMALLPTVIGSSSSRTALGRLQQYGSFPHSSKSIIRTPAITMALEEASGGDLAKGQSGLDAASFFGFAGVDLDPDSFLVEKISTYNDSILMETSFVPVYSADVDVDGSVGGDRGGASLPVRIYWTTPEAPAGTQTDDESDNIKRIFEAFEGKVTSCWIDYSDSDGNKMRRMVHNPEQLTAALGSLEPKTPEKPEAIATFEEIVLNDNCGDARINPDAIDGSSLQPGIFLDRDGFVLEVFSANRKQEVQPMMAAAAENQTIWWKTLNIDCDKKDPYGVLSEVWTDGQFRTLIRSLGVDEETLFLRHLAIRLKRFAILTRRHASEIGWVFQRQDRELPAREAQQAVLDNISLVVQRLVSVAGISFLAGWFLGVDSSKAFWGKKIPKGVLYGVTTGLVKNRAYLRSMVVWLSCVLAVEGVFKPALYRTWPLERKSPVVEHLTTLSIAMQSVGIFLHAVQDFISLMLVKIPVVASLKLLFTTTAWWQRRRGFTKHALFDGMIERLSYRKNDCDKSRPFWMDAIIFAPVREELVFRFAFDKVWHGVLGAFAKASVDVCNSSSLLPPAWIWANSLLFGLMHACNWLPVQLHPSFASGHDGADDGDIDVWENIFGALFQSTGTFVTAFFVFNPLYVRHGLSSSIGAHAALNSVSVGLPLLIRKAARSIGLETEGEGTNKQSGP